MLNDEKQKAIQRIFKRQFVNKNDSVPEENTKILWHSMNAKFARPRWNCALNLPKLVLTVNQKIKKAETLKSYEYIHTSH